MATSSEKVIVRVIPKISVQNFMRNIEGLSRNRGTYTKIIGPKMLPKWPPAEK